MAKVNVVMLIFSTKRKIDNKLHSKRALSDSNF